MHPWITTVQGFFAFGYCFPSFDPRIILNGVPRKVSHTVALLFFVSAIDHHGRQLLFRVGNAGHPPDNGSTEAARSLTGFAAMELLLQRVDQVRFQIQGVFQTDGESHEIVMDAAAGPLLRRHRRGRHARGIAEQRFHTAETFGEHE